MSPWQASWLLSTVTLVGACSAGPTCPATPPASGDRFSIYEREVFFDISASSRSDFFREAKRVLPVKSESAPNAVAMTTENICFSYGGQRLSDSRCAVTWVAMDVYTTSYVPRWSNASGASHRDGAWYLAARQMMLAHEKRHREIAHAYALRLHQRVKGMDAPNCPELRRRIDDLATSIYAEIAEAYRKLDLDEGHWSTD